MSVSGDTAILTRAEMDPVMKKCFDNHVKDLCTDMETAICSYWEYFHHEAIWVFFAYFRMGTHGNGKEYVWCPIAFPEVNHAPESAKVEKWTPFDDQMELWNFLSFETLGWIFQLFWILTFRLEESQITVHDTRKDVDKKVILISFSFRAKNLNIHCINTDPEDGK